MQAVLNFFSTLRKTGGYIASHADDTPELIMARALQVANETLERHKQQVETLRMQNELQQNELKASAPKVQYFDVVLQSTSTYTKPRTHTYTRSDGSTGTNTITVFTEKGCAFIHSLIEEGVPA
ncbi:hypothetical protein AGMMS50239_27150 [Bacteroidia bacterium]|nr:hypothetical protein AGMMS50239_27150 [Bacteroidia bacterium]